MRQKWPQVRDSGGGGAQTEDVRGVELTGLHWCGVGQEQAGNKDDIQVSSLSN